MSRTFALLAAGLAFAAALAGATGAAAAAPRDEALRELGRRLFFDPAIGRRGRIGCASCHDPEHGFSDRRARSVDETGEANRHSQPLTDLTGEGFHWDGEFDTVRSVIEARVLSGAAPALSNGRRALARVTAAVAKGSGEAPSRRAIAAAVVRMGGSSVPYYRSEPRPAQVVGVTIADRLAARSYAPGFEAAFGDAAVTEPRIADALEAYLASLRTSENALDRHLAGDGTALSASARRGLDLFRGRAACAQCHVVDGPRPLLTDGAFHDTGVEASRVALARAHRRDAREDRGRLDASFLPSDNLAFKTPGLRDVARRAPYFHDASAATLEEVVRYYDRGAAHDEEADERLVPLHLTDGEVADLVAFLESLTGGERAGLGRAAPDRDRTLRVRVEHLDGSAVAGMPVEVRAFGDRLAPADRMPAPFVVTTGADGEVVAEFPASTHVVLTPSGMPASDPFPDWTREARLVYVPEGRSAARVIGTDLPERFAVARPDPEAASPAPAVIPPGGSFATPEPSFVTFALVREIGPGEAIYAVVAAPEATVARDVEVDVISDGAVVPAPGRLGWLRLATRTTTADAAATEELRRAAAAIEQLAREHRTTR